MNFRTYLISAIGVCILVIAGLYLLSDKPNQQKNGFNRVFTKNSPLLPLGVIDLKSKALYIAGTANNTIYLGNIMRPEKITYTNNKLSDMDSLLLKFDGKAHVAWKALKITVDSPSVYAHEEMTPTLMKGTVVDTKMHRVDLGNLMVNEVKPITENTILVKTFDTSAKKYVIQRLSSHQPAIYSFFLKQRDNNPFRTSGILLYNKQWDEIIYTYYFKNGYLRLDARLKEKLVGKTIDTMYHFNSRTAEVKSDKAVKLLAGSVIVNKNACTFQDRLYIKSQLNSDNFSLPEFNRYTVIDVYDYRKGKYLHSFYLTKYQDMDLYDFCVINNKMYVLYENFLVGFDISE